MQLPDLSAADTSPKLLLHNAAHWGSEVALREKEYGIWHVYSWADSRRAGARSWRWACWRSASSAATWSAIIGRNRPHWLWAELAAHSVGAMSLGIYEDALGKEVAVPARAMPRPGSPSSRTRSRPTSSWRSRASCRALRWIVYNDARGMRKYHDPRLLSREQLIERGQGAPAGALRAGGRRGQGRRGRGPLHDLGHDRPPQARDAPASRRCSSTSPPICAPSRASRPTSTSRSCRCPGSSSRSTSSLMSLLCADPGQFPGGRAHGRSRICARSGRPTCCSRRASGSRSRPTSTPACSTPTGSAARSSRGAVDARRRRRSTTGRRSWLADWLLFDALRDRLGLSRVKSAATGGSALGPDTFRFFLAMGVPLRQLYGQTETLGAYTIQTRRRARLRQLGPAVRRHRDPHRRARRHRASVRS